jgi:hypothetical protein
MHRLPWFQDFNDRVTPSESAAEEPPPPPEEPADRRLEAWTEGFLAGCRASASAHSRDVAAELKRQVAEIERSLAMIADQSAATMGGLLIDMLAASAPPGWPADRLGAVVEVIRPIFELEPRLHIQSREPGAVSFRDLPALYRALESGDWDLTLRWDQVGAGIDRSEMTVALRQAIGPLAAEDGGEQAGAADSA